ncbi:hypothetical protein WM008_21560 [Vibrio vulnificus]|uniref:lipopolysaccharide biosynthesis protein n=1 Tax=Vibrio vulnificus TaxID=672 RepID=UPI001EEBD18E|nr:hypothetical protein [Vibrio vulnificus]MCG6270845.1 hypothetical protein [Vibrio vulnificus]MCU8185776.1 hypothetical protein [Vibrio vulnificus]
MIGIKLILRSLLASAFSYVLTLYLIRNLTVEQFGEYSYLILIASFSLVFVVFGTDNTIARDSKKFGCKHEFAGFLLIFKLLNLVLCCAVLWVSGIAKLQEIVCFLVATLYLGSSFEVMGKNLTFSNIFVLERLAYTVVVFFLFFTIKVELGLLYGVLLCISLMSLFVQVKIISPSFKNVTFRGLISIYKNNAFIVISVLVLFGYGGGGRFYLESKYGKEALGIFSAFWQVLMVATLIQSQLEKIWRTKFINANCSLELKRMIGKYLFETTLPIFIGALTLSIFRREVTLLVFGEKFVTHSQLLIVMSFYFVVVNIDSLYRMIFIQFSKDKQYMIAHAVSVSLMFLGLFFEDYGFFVFSILIVSAHFFAIVLLTLFWSKKYKMNSFEGNNLYE